MQQPELVDGIHCNGCGYEGRAKSNNSAMFLVFLAMIFLSAFFLPIIVLALAYLVWIITQPPKKKCPECKSSNVNEMTIELGKATSKAAETKESTN